MLKEFPSTPDEAFEGAMDGAVYGREIRALGCGYRIGQFLVFRRESLSTHSGISALAMRI